MTNPSETALNDIPQEVLDAARQALANAGPIDNVYVHIEHGEVDRVAHAVLSAALSVWREQTSGSADLADPVAAAAWQPEPGISNPNGHDYEYGITNAEVDARAREGHGRVRPLPDGRYAKCPGVKGCGVCRREQELLDAGLVE